MQSKRKNKFLLTIFLSIGFSFVFYLTTKHPPHRKPKEDASLITSEQFFRIR